MKHYKCSKCEKEIPTHKTYAEFKFEIPELEKKNFCFCHLCSEEILEFIEKKKRKRESDLILKKAREKTYN